MNSIPAYKLTVVIPAYKAEGTIRRAIDSVLHQEGCDTTVIVVVDGDLDSTAQVARGYRDPRVHILVNSENKGVSFTRNRGLDQVKDEFVMFLDADDFVEGPLLAGLAREMRTSGADLGLGPMQTLLEMKGGRGPTTVLNVDPVQDLFTGWLANGRFVTPCSVLWRTSFLRRVGGWDLDLHRQEDGELVMRAILLGGRVVRSDHGRGIYVIHDSADRLTQRSDNLESLLLVPEKLLGIDSSVIPTDVVKQACAASYYNAAQTCFTRGRGDVGHEALRRSRELGFRGHRGRAVHKLISYAIGLRTRCELERSVRRSIVPHLARIYSVLKHILQILKFGIVSALGLAIDFLLFLALLQSEFSPFVANAASATAAVTFVYFASVKRVFSYRGRFMAGMFAAYVVYQAIGIALASWAVDALGRTFVSPAIGKILILPGTFSANYLFMFLLTRHGKARSESAGR